MESSSAGTWNMQVCALCSTSNFVQWLHLARGHLNNSFGRCLSCFILMGRCRKQTKYITVLLTWTRNIASISAQPATIKGAAKTFLLSFKVIICVAHLWTQSSLDTGECNGSRTHFNSIEIQVYQWGNQIKIVRPEIKHHLGTCHFNQAFKFGRLEGNFNLILSEFNSILSDWLSPLQIHVLSWISHILIQLV